MAPSLRPTPEPLACGTTHCRDSLTPGALAIPPEALHQRYCPGTATRSAWVAWRPPFADVVPGV